MASADEMKPHQKTNPSIYTRMEFYDPLCHGFSFRDDIGLSFVGKEMPSPKRRLIDILGVCIDAGMALAKTRGLILERAGYRVFTVAQFSAAMLVLVNQQIDMTVVKLR